MLQGICVDPAATTVLEKDRKYFLFPAGANHYYVSRFPKANAHTGCFHKSLFQVVPEDEWPPEPAADNVPVLDSSKIYEAKLIWRTRGYRDTKLGTYYLRPDGTHAYFWHDRKLKRPGGCFPLHWFTEFREVNAEETETKAPEHETKGEIPEKFEQINIFDFID